MVALGKLIRFISRLTGRGGSALPGLVIERLYPRFLARSLAPLSGNIIIVIGTNGKTTTTKVLADLLRSQGERVLTNGTGSNFTRGVITTVVNSYHRGHLQADVAVLELDEAYAPQFAAQVAPDYVLMLNLMRDQLDRYGELSYALKLMTDTAAHATRGVIMNGNEPEFVAFAPELKVPVHFYGAGNELRDQFPSDALLLATKQATLAALPQLDVALSKYNGYKVTYHVGDQPYTAMPQLNGQYNYHNIAGTLALLNQYLPNVPMQSWIDALTHIKPPFGRGETIQTPSGEIELVLVKNPGGFQQALRSYPGDHCIMICINDNYADGRDPSWLWDVDFRELHSAVALTSGSRGYDMALRLQYDNKSVDAVETDLDNALTQFLALHQSKKLIFATYTAMLHLRRNLTHSALAEGDA